MEGAPKTLQDAVVFFSDPDNCVNFMIARRWPNGVSCPTCGRTDVTYVAKRRVWQCKTRHKKCQFSVKVGTIFEDSPIHLSKWLMAMWMVANCKNGISSYEISRAIGVTQKSTWFMMHRIREAMGLKPEKQMGGKGAAPVEADETFIGGKPKNRHFKERGGKDRKIPVMGILDRGTREVRASVIPYLGMFYTHGAVARNVAPESTVYTDGWSGYQNLGLAGYIHDTVNHVDQYVKGEVHTQAIENFWSLLKRTLNGTYVAVSPFHLDRYVVEQIFRFNNRINKGDGDRFSKLVTQVSGKRLTYAELTGKVPTEDPAIPF